VKGLGQTPKHAFCRSKECGANEIDMPDTAYVANESFTLGCIAVLELLASQAAISLENARLFSDLQHSEAFLAKGQSISATASCLPASAPVHCQRHFAGRLGTQEGQRRCQENGIAVE
jgi:hypothetical protein